jgi:two-component system sensor histidine kinase UhpB
VVVIEVIAGLLAGAVMVIRARSSTQVEIAASMELAQLLVSEAVTLMQQEVPAEKFLADLSSPLRLIRHVRIVVKDATGALLPMRPCQRLRSCARRARAVLVRRPNAPPIATDDVPVIVNDQRIGTVEIVAEPRDEIERPRGNTVALGIVVSVVNLVVIVILYVLLGGCSTHSLE